MVRLKMQGIGAIVWLLLQVTSAYAGIAGPFPADSLFLPRGKRSATTCDKREMDTLTRSVQATCSYIREVDSHVANVKSKYPISVPSFKDTYGFKDIVHHYNNDLETSKRNCRSWRTGDNVLGSLTDVVAAAREFEPEFKDKFEQNQVRIKLIIKNYGDIKYIEDKIAELEKDITEAKELMKINQAPNAQTYLRNIILRGEEEINSISKNYDVHQAKKELNELIKYLQYVKSLSTEIEGKADIARTKINLFRDKIARDASAFKRHRGHSQEGITKLRQEKQRGNEELANIRREKTDFQKKVADERAQITSLRNQITRARIDLRNMENNIENSKRSARGNRNFGEFLHIIPIFGWIVGGDIIDSADRRLEQLAKQKRAILNEHNQRLRNLNSQIARNNQDINAFQNRISSQEARTREIELELEYFNKLDGSLQSVESEVSSLLPTVANAIQGVDIMKEVFDHIRRNLGDIIEKAKVSKTEAEVRNIKYFIYNQIDDLMCKWNEAHSKMLPLAQCQ